MKRVKVRRRDINFFVWIVPLIALVVGGWMLYRYYAKRGPLIVIAFKNSGGLEPKQSFVRFRDVKVGVVERIEILKSKKFGVKVYARMNRDIVPFLNKTTKFWIVKPEIGLGKVRGLDALMSGSYIQMSAQLDNFKKKLFLGLDEPPLEVNGEKGVSIVLIANSSYNLKEAQPVYYKQMEAGRIKRVEVSKDGKRVVFHLFIKEPFSHFINATSRFWNLRAFRFDISGSGLNVKMASLAQIVIGGIGFDTMDLESKEKAHKFFLYPTKFDALSPKLGLDTKWMQKVVMHFHRAKAIALGTAITFKGFRVGEVIGVKSKLDTNFTISSTITALIDLNAFNGLSGFKEALHKGLRARIKSVAPFLKNYLIDLEMTSRPSSFIQKKDFLILPTSDVKEDETMRLVHDLLMKLKELPLKETMNSLNDLLSSSKKPLSDMLLAITKSANSLNYLLEANQTKEAIVNLNQLLKELQMTSKALRDVAKSYDKESLFQKQISKTLYDIDSATKSLDTLLIKLKKRPNAIIFGD